MATKTSPNAPRAGWRNEPPEAWDRSRPCLSNSALCGVSLPGGPYVCGLAHGHEGNHAAYYAPGEDVTWPDGTVRGQTGTAETVSDPQGSGDRIDGAARAVAPDKPITDGYDSAERWAKLEGELAEWKSEALALRFSLEQANKDWEAQRDYLREKNEIIKAFAGPAGMTPEDVAYALGDVAQLRDQLGKLQAGNAELREDLAALVDSFYNPEGKLWEDFSEQQWDVFRKALSGALRTLGRKGQPMRYGQSRMEQIKEVEMKPFPQEIVDRLHAEAGALDDPETAVLGVRYRQEGVRKAIQIVMDAWAQWGAVRWPEPESAEGGLPAPADERYKQNLIARGEAVREGEPITDKVTHVIQADGSLRRIRFAR